MGVGNFTYPIIQLYIYLFLLIKESLTYNLKLTIVHAPMGRFQLELIYYFAYFSTPSNICMFLSRRPFVVNTTFSTGLVSVEVTSQETEDLFKMLY